MNIVIRKKGQILRAAIAIDPPTTKESSRSEIFLLSMERWPVKWNNDRRYIYIHIREFNINTNKNSDTENRKNLFEFHRKEAVSNSDRFGTFQFKRKKFNSKKKKEERKEETRNQFLKITKKGEQIGKKFDTIIKVQQTVHNASVPLR